jgi:serine phosphatase RsbU (regulator of sigma subunit)
MDIAWPLLREAAHVSIPITCACGHQFRAKDKYAGKQGKCPGCGRLVRVPALPSLAAPPVPRKAPHRLAPQRRLARAMAAELIPKSLPHSPIFEAAGMCLSARQPGHDYYDCLQLHDGSWAALVATVHARGIEAAASALQLRAATHALALGYSDPGAILSLLNRVFAADWPENRSATMLMVRLDPRTRELSYTSAGHTAGYVLDMQGRVKWNLESADCPIGLLAHTMYGTSAPLRLEPGEAVLLFSAGMVGATAADGTQLGAPRLLQAASAHLWQPAGAIVESLRRLLPHGRRPAHDASALVVKLR